MYGFLGFFATKMKYYPQKRSFLNYINDLGP